MTLFSKVAWDALNRIPGHFIHSNVKLSMLDGSGRKEDSISGAEEELILCIA